MRRKISKSKLENWLFRPGTQASPHLSRSSSTAVLYTSPGDSNVIGAHGPDLGLENERHHRSSEPIQYSHSISSSRNSSLGPVPMMTLTTPPTLQSPISNTPNLIINNKVRADQINIWGKG